MRIKQQSRPYMALWCCCLVMFALVEARMGSFALLRHQRRSLKSQDTNSGVLSSTNDTWMAHECLWTMPGIKAAEATATATASVADTSNSYFSTAQASADISADSSVTFVASQASATAVAVATASATAVASASAQSTASRVVACSLNPSYFFSLPAPEVDGEKLLLEITAMRYGCLNHTSFQACTADQANWCTWQEENDRCGMYYDDADFVHMLLWSRTRVACPGSQLQQVVNCSYSLMETDCNSNIGCAWAEGACYPAFYAPLVNKPRSLAAFKKQVYSGDEAVWGSCAGADLYKTYSRICNYGEQACIQDPNCSWLPEYQSEVLTNPLNFSKPCHLSTTRFPIESVFLSVNSNFSTAVIDAQKECIHAKDEATCTARTANISSNILEAALDYKASMANATSKHGDTVGPGGENIGVASEGTFVASWSQMGDAPALLQLGPDFKPGSLSPVDAAANKSMLETAPNMGGLAAAPSEDVGSLDVKAPPNLLHKSTPAGSANMLAALKLRPAQQSATEPVFVAASMAQTNAGPFSAVQPLQRLNITAMPVLLPPGLRACTTPATCRAAMVSLRTLHVRLRWGLRGTGVPVA